MNVTMDIVKRISDFLGIKDWSAYQLSLESGIPKSTIYRILAHEVSPSIEQMEMICDAFNISLEDFFTTSITGSAEEVELIHLYRTLSKDSKRMLLMMLKNMK